MSSMCSSRFLRRALARTSPMEMAGVSFTLCRLDDDLDNLLGAHLAGEDEARLALVDGDVFDDVHHEGGFSHRGACGHDEHLAGLESLAHFVEPGVAGGDSFESAFAGRELLEDLDDTADQLSDADLALGRFQEARDRT